MMPRARSMALLLVLLLLAGCGVGPGPASEETPVAAVTPATTGEAPVRPTASPVESTEILPGEPSTLVATETVPVAAAESATVVPTAGPSKTSAPTLESTRTPLPTDTPVPPPTDTPVPSPTPTEVRPASCPRLRKPDAPPQPALLADYPAVLGEYLNAGASVERLENLLHEWGAIAVGAGDVVSVDLTGDGVDEIVVALTDPSPEGQGLPWSAGDVLVYRCEAKAMILAYQGYDPLAAREDEDGGEPVSYHLQPAEDAIGNGVADLIYLTRSCGAHTCFDQIHVVDWDGGAFVERTPDIPAYPYPTFHIGRGQITVKSAGIGSAGAGIQRTHEEVWSWNGTQFVLTSATEGPPRARVHYLHDGDAALARGDYPAAAEAYREAVENTYLETGLFLDDEEMARAVVEGYARFKLVVAFAAAGDRAGAEERYNELVAAHPPGSLGSRYTGLGEVFWNTYGASGDAWAACGAVAAEVEMDPTPAERLYAGYANPEYGAEDLCRLP
jgi:hypothetical protein